MGKENFKKLYKRIKYELGSITCKISGFSDEFDEDKDYAGMIVYAIDGEFAWENTGGITSGYRGKSFYIIIQCTDDWPPEVLRDVGKGQVHHYLIKNTFGFDFNQDIICCGGFSYHEKTLKYSSVWLNERDQTGCKSDGTKYLSRREKVLVKYCFKKYKQNGINYAFPIPSYIDKMNT
ncbi:hypothetical protein C2G38_2174731 [Gigaspora rosea]|uniref:Uncharacterized protein n=1 Tax=Gigaspora rosea TaxID=44941 RepID=A0A397VI51_9GLOM|nr:hypothetical protein C2G38_2174731 [Gigaspora rosea]CAG8693525.1 7341_t:CDS:1 [Gigaspora rosea]